MREKQQSFTAIWRTNQRRQSSVPFKGERLLELVRHNTTAAATVLQGAGWISLQMFDDGVMCLPDVYGVAVAPCEASGIKCRVAGLGGSFGKLQGGPSSSPGNRWLQNNGSKERFAKDAQAESLKGCRRHETSICWLIQSLHTSELSSCQSCLHIP